MAVAFPEYLGQLHSTLQRLAEEFWAAYWAAHPGLTERDEVYGLPGAVGCDFHVLIDEVDALRAELVGTPRDLYTEEVRE